ncbi:MAG: hypothetical protein V9E86_09640 [Nitrosomonas sp.]
MSTTKIHLAVDGYGLPVEFAIPVEKQYFYSQTLLLGFPNKREFSC